MPLMMWRSSFRQYRIAFHTDDEIQHTRSHKPCGDRDNPDFGVTKLFTRFDDVRSVVADRDHDWCRIDKLHRENECRR